MYERLDAILLGLVELAEKQIKEAKDREIFNKDIAESTGIVLTLAYARWSGEDGN